MSRAFTFAPDFSRTSSTIGIYLCVDAQAWCRVVLIKLSRALTRASSRSGVVNQTTSPALTARSTSNIIGKLYSEGPKFLDREWWVVENKFESETNCKASFKYVLIHKQIILSTFHTCYIYCYWFNLLPPPLHSHHTKIETFPTTFLKTITMDGRSAGGRDGSLGQQSCKMSCTYLGKCTKNRTRIIWNSNNNYQWNYVHSLPSLFFCFRQNINKGTNNRLCKEKSKYNTNCFSNKLEVNHHFGKGCILPN